MREAWSNCLWTGVALIKFQPRDGVTIDTTLRIDDDGDVFPAMPDDIMSTLPDCARKFERVLRSRHLKYATSLCTIMGVTSNPIKPHVGEANPEVQDYLDLSSDGLGNFYPDKLLKLNIGSNLGLLRVLREFYENRLLHVDGIETDYHFITCDVNIYTRTLRVIYEKQNCCFDCFSYGVRELVHMCSLFLLFFTINEFVRSRILEMIVSIATCCFLISHQARKHININNARMHT